MLEFILFPNIVFGQTLQQLEVDKLKKEIELLDLQIKNASQDTPSFYNTPAFNQTLAILGGDIYSWSNCIFRMAARKKNSPTC